VLGSGPGFAEAGASAMLNFKPRLPGGFM
jgi:hypothetical protein